MSNEVTLNLTDTSVKVMRGYMAVSNKPADQLTAEIEQLVSDFLESTLKLRIAEELGVETKPQQLRTQHAFHDTTGISDGLGDQEIPDPEQPVGERQAEALVPDQGGLTDRDLEADMDVQNPAVEAKGEAKPAEPGEEADDTFASLAGFVDHRVSKRKKRLTGKGRVSLATDSTIASEHNL